MAEEVWGCRACVAGANRVVWGDVREGSAGARDVTVQRRVAAAEG